MSEHLEVQKYIERLRGFAQAQPEPYCSALEQIANEIDRLVGITYSNFLARAEQIQMLTTQIKLSEVREPKAPEPPQSPQDEDREHEALSEAAKNLVAAEADWYGEQAETHVEPNGLDNFSQAVNSANFGFAGKPGTEQPK